MSTGRSSRASSRTPWMSIVGRFGRRADRVERNHVEEVGQLDLHVVAAAQDLFGFVAGVAEILDRDRDLGRIEIEDAGAAFELFAEAVHARDLVEPQAGLVGDLDRARKQRRTFERHLPARDVERGDQHEVGRGRQEELVDGLETVELDAVPLHVQHRRLRHGAEHLVRRVDAHVGAGLHRRQRQRGVEVEVRAPGLVDEQRDVVLVRDRRDRLEVGRDAVVRRGDDVDRLDVGLALDRRAHRRRGDRVIHVQRLVDLGLHPDGRGAGHDQAAHRALVRVARQRQLVARIERGHHHALVAAGRAVDQEERLLRAEALGGELLRFDQRLFGLQQVVEPADLGEVDRQHVVADEIAEGALHPDALLVPGRVERDDAGVDVVEQDLEVRRARLVERRRRGLPGSQRERV